MENEKITRREMLRKMALGAGSLVLLSHGLTACTGKQKETAATPPKADQTSLASACTGCGSCHCPYGVDIAACLTLYNEQARANELPDPRQSGSAAYREDSEHYIAKLNSRIPRLAQADRCVGCDKCEGMCSRGVDIRLSLRQIEMLTEKVKSDGTLA